MKRKTKRTAFKRSKRTRAKMRGAQRARRVRESWVKGNRALHATIHAKTVPSATSAQETRENPSPRKGNLVLNGSGSGRIRGRPKNGSVARLSEPLESFSRAFGRA